MQQLNGNSDIKRYRSLPGSTFSIYYRDNHSHNDLVYISDKCISYTMNVESKSLLDWFARVMTSLKEQSDLGYEYFDLDFDFYEDSLLMIFFYRKETIEEKNNRLQKKLETLTASINSLQESLEDEQKILNSLKEKL